MILLIRQQEENGIKLGLIHPKSFSSFLSNSLDFHFSENFLHKRHSAVKLTRAAACSACKRLMQPYWKGSISPKEREREATLENHDVSMGMTLAWRQTSGTVLYRKGVEMIIRS